MLTTLAKVKTLLGITDSASDTVLTEIINACSDYIEKYCGRTFTKPNDAIAETVDGNGSNILFVKNIPIDTITKIEKRTGKSTWEEIDSTSYRENTATGEICFDTSTIEGFQNYKVTYKGGYATIPADLDMACQQLSAHEYNSRGQGGDIKSESLGEYSVTYQAEGTAGSETDKFIDSVLERYKLQRI